MKLAVHLKEAYINLLSAKLRSFLAILGVMVGTASVVALVSGGELATEHALAQFKRLGTDLLSATIQYPGNGQLNSTNGLSVDDIEKVLDGNNDIHSFSPYALNFSSVFFAGKRQQSSVAGVTENLRSIMKVNLSAGRFISDFDNKQRFCVVGGELAKSIKTAEETSADLIGRQIKLDNNYFTIVGVLQETQENMFFLVNINKSVLVPLSAALIMNKYSKINNIIFKFDKNADIAHLKNTLTNRFQNVAPSLRLFFRSPQEIITSMKNQNRTFTLLLGFIGSIALVVGGIGVMNIMLVSVVERRREIGIRLAVGAKEKDVLMMFLSESIALTLFGGLMGVFLGEAVAYFTAHVSGWGFHLYPIPLFVGFGVSALVGMFFGIYPAMKASRLDPIVCLRSE